MNDTNPVHGLWCSARLKRTACGTCGRPVLLFFCDCGTIAMLETDGDAWPVHACRPQPVQNRFSEMDAFAIGRDLQRRLTAADLESGTPDPLRFIATGEPMPALDQWAPGQIRAVQASFDGR